MALFHVLHDDVGAATLEWALVLPFYLLFIFSTLELGHIYWQYTSIQAAADDAARCSAIGFCNCKSSTACTPLQKAYEDATGIWPSQTAADAEITVSPSTTCGSAPGTYAQVIIDHQMTSIINGSASGYFLSPMANPFQRLRVQSCYPVKI